MIRYRLCARPRLMIDSHEYYWGDSISFGIKSVDAEIKQRLAQDPGGLAFIIRFAAENEWKTQVADVKFQFCRRNMRVDFSVARELTDEDIEFIREHIDEAGPDTWMEGNIDLLTAESIETVNKKLDRDFQSVEMDMDFLSLKRV